MATSFSSVSMCSMYRIGQGEDIHILSPNRKLVLGGVTIPYSLGLLGHSDADVVYHAVSDSLLGALALGDIGHYFPPNDPSITGINSEQIVNKCVELTKDRGYLTNNIDVMIFAEKPKLAPYVNKMRANLARLLEVSIDQVSVKCGTNEKMDAVGRGEAIRATSVILMKKE